MRMPLTVFAVGIATALVLAVTASFLLGVDAPPGNSSPDSTPAIQQDVDSAKILRETVEPAVEHETKGGDSQAQFSSRAPSDGNSFPYAICVAFLAVIVGFITTVLNLWYFRHQLFQKETEGEILRLQGLLDGFYGPLVTLKRTSKNLHDILKFKTAPTGEVAPENWRTLRRLLEGHKFAVQGC